MVLPWRGGACAKRLQRERLSYAGGHSHGDNVELVVTKGLGLGMFG